jgi:succinyl-diaminopimelate desuccinylase
MEEIIRLTRDLIRFKSMHSNPEEIRACAEFIEHMLSMWGISYRRLDRADIPSIFALPEIGFAPVLLMSHIDVVDAPDEIFSPVEREGKLYGRGSIDDKYAVALSLVLLKEWVQRLRKQGKSQDSLPFGLLITGDEETGGHHGAKEALKEIKTDFCIALDGGHLRKIVQKEKGVLQLKLVSRGKAAHGARPWMGENAVEKLFADYVKMKSHFQESSPEHWHKTLNFSIVHAGKSVNQVPDYAEAFFDIRYTENDDIDEVILKIRREIQGELVVQAKEPLFWGGDPPYLRLLLEVAKGTEIGFDHGASDARFLMEHGVEGIVWGADGDLSQHSREEHLNIHSVYSLYALLDEFMKRIERKGRLAPP